jgi:hypothetical protein
MATSKVMSVEEVAGIIRQMSREEMAKLVRLVPELLEIEAPKAELPRRWDEAELRGLLLQKLKELGEEYHPMRDDDPFIGGFTVKEYFELPDEEQEALWNKLYAEESEKLEELEVKSPYELFEAKALDRDIWLGLSSLARGLLLRRPPDH